MGRISYRNAFALFREGCCVVLGSQEEKRVGGRNGVGGDDGPRKARSDGFKYVYKMGAQGMLGALTSLLGRLA